MDISILTVVRNDASGLALTLASVARVRRQTRHVIRHFVVDGASTDATLEVMRSSAATLDAWVSEPDLGIYDAMNKSARLAPPDSLLLWINAGDELLPLDELLDELGSQDFEAIFAAVQLPEGHVIAPHIRRPYNERNVFPLTVFRHQGFFIRGDSFARMGGYRLDVGSQADGLLMSLAVQRLRFVESVRAAAIFKLDGVSNTRHLSVLQSYFKVIAALDMSKGAIVWHQRSYLLKSALKVVLPARWTASIMRRRWGTR